MKHPFFDGFVFNLATGHGLANSGSNKNIGENATNMIGSGGAGKVPGSRGFRIESRKGILSRKSSVNKNSFYKQKTKDTLPNKMYGSGASASYFNK